MNKQQWEAFFVNTCRQQPYLQQLLEPATLIENSIQFRPDYSYFSTQICGENYYSIGDAAAFVDPIFSHGVQNAFYNAAVTALTIKESLKTPEKRLRLSRLCENRMQQFYGFSRALFAGRFWQQWRRPRIGKSINEITTAARVRINNGRFRND